MKTQHFRLCQISVVADCGAHICRIGILISFSKKCRDIAVDGSRWSTQLTAVLKSFPFYISWNVASVPKKSKGDPSKILLVPSGPPQGFCGQAAIFLFLIFCHLLIQSFLMVVIFTVLSSYLLKLQTIKTTIKSTHSRQPSVCMSWFSPILSLS